MLKIGLIGAGFMGDMHATCYAALENEGVKVTAVADVVAEKAQKLAECFGAKVFKDGASLIEQADVDIVDICLPTYLHAQHAVKAMKKNRAVFIEKPVCLKAAEAELLLETQKETKAVVMVGQCLRHWPEYMWLKETADSGRYGKIVSAVFTRLSSKPAWAWENWLHDVKKSGSMALDLHIHDVDFVRYLIGEPKDVKVRTARDPEGVIQHIITAYSFEGSDVMVCAEGAWYYPDSFPFSAGYRVKFEKATAVFDSGKDPSVTVYTNDEGIVIPEFDSQSGQKSQSKGNISSLKGYYNELKYFINRIKTNQPIETAPLSEGVLTLKLALRQIEEADK